MDSLRTLLIIGTLITASAFGAKVLSQTLAPFDFKGKLIYTYRSGQHPINLITYELDHNIAENLVILKTPDGWNHYVDNNVLTLNGGELYSGEEITVIISLNKYVEPKNYPMVINGTTSNGGTVQSTGILVVNFMMTLFSLNVLYSLRFLISFTMIGIGLFERYQDSILILVQEHVVKKSRLDPYLNIRTATDQEIEQIALAFEQLFGRAEQDSVLDDNFYLYLVDDEIITMQNLIQS